MGLRVRACAMTAVLAATLLGVPASAVDHRGHAGRAVAASAPVAELDTLRSKARPGVRGVRRFNQTLVAGPGRWSSPPSRVRYQWLRSGEPIRGATGRRHRIAPEDVGTQLRVQVTAYAAGHRAGRATSAAGRLVRHRVDVRRRVTYRVETRGRIAADLAVFRRQAQATYDDARGWRARGVAFRQVRRGGSFTLVLAEASTVPGFSSGCSSTWSCRVGRFVIINQTRWQRASPAWNAGRLSRRDYRHMVVNHETGHWLGEGHVGCSRRGAPAPVMMQQSKGTDGCRFNPWPTRAELR